MPEALSVVPVAGLPEVRAGDDLAELITAALRRLGLTVVEGDVLVVSSKVASKALGLWAADRDQAIRDETVRVVAERTAGGRVTQVVESAAGPVMAAAGVDASNTGAADGVLLLPRDPDAVCDDLLARLRVLLAVDRLGVVLSDTAGRPWRAGQVDFALGAAGFVVLDDLRGGVDADGRPLAVTARAVADEVASAADLVKGKASAIPVALVRGLGDLVSSAPSDGARSVVRTGVGDWFGYGPAEAVRAALGVEPGSPQSDQIGFASVEPEPVAVKVGRAVAVALAGDYSDDHSDHDDSVGVDVGPDRVIVTGPDAVARGVTAARLCVALWGEGLRGVFQSAEHRSDQSVVVRVRGADGEGASGDPAR